MTYKIMWDDLKLLNRTNWLLRKIAWGFGIYIAITLICQRPEFALKQIDIKGDLRHTSHAEIEWIASQHIYGNFFSVRLSDVKEKFSKLPWIKKITVERKWQHRLLISLEEHKEIAHWATTALGNIGLVDADGTLFYAALDKAGLPIFSGPEESVKLLTQTYYSIQTLLSQEFSKNKIQPKILGMNANKQLEISLHLMLLSSTEDQKLELMVQLGNNKSVERLKRFLVSYQEGLIQDRFNYVDLRYPHGFSVGLDQGGAVVKN